MSILPGRVNQINSVILNNQITPVIYRCVNLEFRWHIFFGSLQPPLFLKTTNLLLVTIVDCYWALPKRCKQVPWTRVLWPAVALARAADSRCLHLRTALFFSNGWARLSKEREKFENVWSAAWVASSDDQRSITNPFRGWENFSEKPTTLRHGLQRPFRVP